MAQRGGQNTFDRLFSRAATGGDEEEAKPSVHELFSAFMGESISLRAFAEALLEYHNIHITHEAANLMMSNDAASGRVTFQQFQRALQGGGFPLGASAGKANTYKDAVSSIIADNSGPPLVGGSQPSAKGVTKSDISNEPYIKAVHQAQKNACGPYGTKNPVLLTNDCSYGNPLVSAQLEATLPSGSQGGGSKDDAYGAKEMANTAARMYIGGELNKREFEKYLERLGVPLRMETELQKLIFKQDATGGVKFLELSRAIQREMV